MINYSEVVFRLNGAEVPNNEPVQLQRDLKLEYLTFDF